MPFHQRKPSTLGGCPALRDTTAGEGSLPGGHCFTYVITRRRPSFRSRRAGEESAFCRRRILSDACSWKGALCQLRVLRKKGADLRFVKLFVFLGYTGHEAIAGVSSKRIKWAGFAIGAVITCGTMKPLNKNRYWRGWLRHLPCSVCASRPDLSGRSREARGICFSSFHPVHPSAPHGLFLSFILHPSHFILLPVLHNSEFIILFSPPF